VAIFIGNAAKLGQGKLGAFGLGSGQLDLLPQTLDQLVTPHLDHGHVCGFDCCTQLEGCESCHVLFLSLFDKAQTIL
jgi:hypothetical protein